MKIMATRGIPSHENYNYVTHPDCKLSSEALAQAKTKEQYLDLLKNVFNDASMWVNPDFITKATYTASEDGPAISLYDFNAEEMSAGKVTDAWTINPVYKPKYIKVHLKYYNRRATDRYYTNGSCAILGFCFRPLSKNQWEFPIYFYDNASSINYGNIEGLHKDVTIGQSPNPNDRVYNSTAEGWHDIQYTLDVSTCKKCFQTGDTKYAFTIFAPQNLYTKNNPLGYWMLNPVYIKEFQLLY